MDFEEFRENLMEDLRDQIYQRTGNDCTVEATNVAKLQNAGYEGIVIRPEESPVGINLDAQALYNDYENGKNYEDVLEGAVRMTTEGFAHQPEFNIDDFSNYDVMKEKLSMQIVPTERNAEMLEKIPHKEIEDMSVVCRFVVGNDETTGLGTILVNNDMLQNFGITEEQLFADAAKYAPDLRPSEILGMADVLAQMMGVDVSELGEQFGLPENATETPMYVASTQDRTNGAGIIAYPGFMDMASEKLGGDFFLLPSSVHEVILIPDKGDGNYRDLESMVQEVNSTQVDPKDQLSDHVYHYDSREKVFELAEKFAARQELKAQAAEKGSVLKDLESGKKEIAGEPRVKTPKAPGKDETSL